MALFLLLPSLLCFSLVASSFPSVSSSSSSSDVIHGCGGFVEPDPKLTRVKSNSDPKPDYSHITVDLQTVDGLIKETVHCAPNGYYFIPSYDKGTFFLSVKGPPGWSWNPSRVTVVVDQEGCNGNNDINFRYTGFSLSGKVVGAVGGPSCSSKGKGPAGVSIRLKSKNGYLADTENVAINDALLPSVLTSLDGDFKFVDLTPGEYVLEAYHPNFDLEVKGDPHVKLGFGNVDVGEIFFVNGYSVEGSVVSQGIPVLGVHVYLYSDDITAVKCGTKSISNSASHGKALCHSVSDANGKFVFNSLPCGKFKLVPFYRGENTVFDVSPSEVEVNVGHDNIFISEPFKVTGFSIGGRVVDSQGEGIEGVQILIDDLLKAVTDIGGYYKLDQVTSTKYTIKAQKSHYKFSSLENFMVLPNMASLPDIVATKYDLCGSIVIDSNTHSLRRQVALTHGPANVNAQTKWVDVTGSFCFEVPPGEYRLTPITSKAEQLSGLVFASSYIDVLVTTPILDVVLTQAQVSVSGSVKCIVECDANVSVFLSPIVPGTQTLDPKRKQATSLRDESNSFLFEKVLPGKYQLTVRHEPLNDIPGLDDAWCWKRNTLEADVGTSNLENIQFIQKGFWMAVHSTHDAEASILQPDGKTSTRRIVKGWQHICVEQPGMYTLQILKTCTSFGLFPFTFDTSNPIPIKLVAQKYMLSGQILIENSANMNMEDLANNIVVLVWRGDGSFADSNNRLRPVTSENGSAFLEYTHWADMGDKLTFVPRDVRGITGYGDSEGAQEYLFYPREQHAYVEVDGCQPSIPSFVARPGMYIKGNVSPSLAGVNIIIRKEGEKNGDALMAVVTESDGSYVVGPLYDDISYVVEAAKAGYHCKALDSENFICQKLGQIIVRILPGQGAEDQLPSVLLSLSGDSGFRKNALTSYGEEAYVFDSLFPGSFFLRPLLKEYSFSPASLAIDLESGSVVDLSFTASRISFSVLGTVTSLIGKPEEGISIEARAESKSYYEEAISDAEGKYRLRGLKPDTIYSIKVSLKDDDNTEFSSRIERASPSSYKLQVNMNDSTGVDFVVFDRPLTTIITGTVEGAEKWQQHLAIRVVASSSSSSSSRVEKVIPLPLSHFFEVQDLPRGKYSVQLVLGLSGKTHGFESNSVDVDLGKNPQVHVGALRFIVQEEHGKQELASAPVTPVVVALLVIVLAFLIQKVIAEGQFWVHTGSTVTASPSQPRKERPLLRKRTY